MYIRTITANSRVPPQLNWLSSGAPISAEFIAIKLSVLTVMQICLPLQTLIRI